MRQSRAECVATKYCSPLEAEMIKRIALFLPVALTLALTMLILTAGALALDTTVVKGTCKDEAGKPIAGATIELTNLDSGHKFTAKTNSHGQYASTNPGAGNYKVTLFDATGNQSSS